MKVDKRSKSGDDCLILIAAIKLLPHLNIKDIRFSG